MGECASINTPSQQIVCDKFQSSNGAVFIELSLYV